MVIALVAGPASEGMGQPGCPAQQIFVRHGGVNMWAGRGMVTTNAVRNPGGSPEPGCTQGRLSTAHLRDDSLNDQVEVGWQKAGPAYYWFTEAEIDYMVVQFRYGNISCCATMRWKLFNVGGTNTWRWQYDPDNDGQNYITLFPDSPNMFYSIGLPMGETELFGGGSTSAYDHHINLKWADSANDSGWHLWDTNILYCDELDGWKWKWTRNYEYEVVVGSYYSTCTP